MRECVFQVYLHEFPHWRSIKTFKSQRKGREYEEHLTDFIGQLQLSRLDIYNTVKLEQMRNIGRKEQSHDTMITEPLTLKKGTGTI